ncbi:MAG: cell division ATP-binding protein FtsE [Tissierellia bacterium]|nr:cell division ATP-binding protein FtsE [Tissierellia bacterium]
MIVLKDIVKEYEEGKAALHHVDLSIGKGEFVYLMGHSGAGKSTVTRLLLKEIEPTSGKIFLNGIDITKVSERRKPYIRRYIGTVFQDFRILENKTVYENVAFALEILGVKNKEIRRRVPIILSLVGLTDKAKNFPRELSGGEKQRVAIARAIINEPPVLIADEPTGNLDMETSLEIMQLLEDINNRGTTILMATHAKDIVKILPRRIILLDHGKLIKDTGEVEEDEPENSDQHI